MRRLLPAMLLALSLPAAVAQTSTAERWFRVELLVFEQPNGTLAEQWEAQPQLRYPDSSNFLLDPSELRALRQEEAPGSQTDAQQGVAPTVSTEAAPAENNSEPPLPTAFLKLPRFQQTLRDKVGYMQRAGGYRILFHETWAQPVPEESRARPLVLDRSGDAQVWPELQGSIRLYRARFLTLETNLWLNTQGSYLPGQWRMPPPPKGPALQPEVAPPAPVPEQTTADSVLPALQRPTEQPDEKAAQDSAAREYPYRHAVLLQQRRRMRSNELHYLDHPLLGVIIQLTPLTEEALAEMAQREAAATPAP